MIPKWIVGYVKYALMPTSKSKIQLWIRKPFKNKVRKINLKT